MIANCIFRCADFKLLLTTQITVMQCKRQKAMQRLIYHGAQKIKYYIRVGPESIASINSSVFWALQNLEIQFSEYGCIWQQKFFEWKKW